MFMNLSESFLSELQHEAAKTRKYLELVPEEHFDWKPHAKSMSLIRLASHVAELAGWAHYTINYPELNLANFDYKPPVLKTNSDLMAMFDQNLANGVEAVKNVTNEQLMENWTLRNGDHIIFTLPKIAVLRDMVYNHLVHHRGQLSVYLRLLDVKIPGLYGPSADEADLVAEAESSATA